MFHRPLSSSIGAAVPPSGGAVGLNMRATLGYPSAGRTDGDIDVFIGGQQSGDMNYPSTYENVNGDTLTGGFQFAAAFLFDYNATWDVRQVGANIQELAPYRIDLAAPGMYRFWIGIGIHVGQAAEFRIWDGELNTGTLRYTFTRALLANEFLNSNNVVRTRTGWVDNYDGDYVDAQIDSGFTTIRVGRYWTHVRVLAL